MLHAIAILVHDLDQELARMTEQAPDRAFVAGRVAVKVTKKDPPSLEGDAPAGGWQMSSMSGRRSQCQ